MSSVLYTTKVHSRTVHTFQPPPTTTNLKMMREEKKKHTILVLSTKILDKSKTNYYKQHNLQSKTMNEGETKTETITLSSSPNDPNEQWAKFYIQANATIAATKEQLEESDEIKSNQNDIQKVYQRILITLDTITKLLFGLSPTRKAQVVVHGGGAIELIVGLVRVSNVLQSMDAIPLAKPIILSSLKAIKIAVLRNPAGRCRCRSADIFVYLSDILKALLNNNSSNKDAEDGMLIEHVFTTLAAICLGDDLNALQVRLLVLSLINAMIIIFNVAKSSFTFHSHLHTG